MAGRIDVHRPGAVAPAEYEYEFSFSVATVVDGWPVPPVNLDLVVEYRAKAVEQGVRFGPVHHATTQCDLCGAHFLHGDVWRHVPTGDYVTIGHICAAKMGLAADRSDWVGARNRAVARARRLAERREVRGMMRRVLEAHPGLSKALRVDHYITRDIRSRFISNGFLSDKQIALLFRLEQQEREREVEPPAVEVPAGRHTVRGTVLGLKTVESRFGLTLKMLLRVMAPGGAYKVWGTVPDSIQGGSSLRGAVVEMSAEMIPKEVGFGFFKRPTRASVVSEAA